ncbi:MAG: NADP-dependent isocitrate dehydrogenase [Candidatus Hydrogenedentes bacterium]|nr:NADP-dependent isocitrate dehydrogenase [Candidatus Hydrogenedentota bacterium]
MPAGEKITMKDGVLQVPDQPIIGFIEGDGIGADIWHTAQRVFDAAVEKCYGSKRKIAWMELLAGERGFQTCGEYLPEESLDAIHEYLVAIKGPLTTPIGKGFRSLNVRIRQRLDLYACVRPVRYFEGVPSPMKRPQDVNMVIFRENTEDVYAGMEVERHSDEALKLRDFCIKEFEWDIPKDAGLGLKPVSRAKSKRLVRAALNYARHYNRKTVTLVHKGNIMKFTEGAFRRWGYQLVRDEFAESAVVDKDIAGPTPKDKIIVNDMIADNFLQKIILQPQDFDVIATMNLNGDYISDALAAQVGGIGIAPGANINYDTGVAVFEATHGSAPKRAGQDIANPSSVILSGSMMFQYMGWDEVHALVDEALERTFAQRIVTYDFARLMDDARKVKCSEFGQALIDNM